MDKQTQNNSERAQPHQTRERRSYWRGLMAATIVAGAIATVLVWPDDSEMPSTVAMPPAPDPAPPAIPQPLLALDRSAMIDAAELAASAFAAGRPEDEALAEIAGRRFRLVMPFGCGGPDETEGALVNGWRFDPDSATLRVVVSPAVFDAQSSVPPREGFWIAAPWLRDPVCPALPAAPDAAESETLAIVRSIDASAPRRGREAGAPYRLSVRIDPAAAPGAGGLRLVLEGRFEADSPGPIACTAPSAQARPTCIFTARFDRIAITDPDGAVTYGEWIE